MNFYTKFFAFLSVLAVISAGDIDNEITSKIVTSSAGSTEERGRLIADLFANYDRRNYPTNITLRFGVSLLKLDVDELASTLETDIWLRQTWDDSRLKWNPEDYGNHTSFRIPSSEVWLPDVMLYNSASFASKMQCTPTNAIVYSTGKVIWVPPCHYRSYCNLTLDRAPLDEQTCPLKFGSWTFDGYSVDLQFYDDKEEADVSDYPMGLSDWQLTGNTAERESKTYDCCVEPYVSLHYKLQFKRKGHRTASCSL